MEYACQLATKVRFVKPVPVVPGRDLAGVLGGKPLLCLAFDSMIMTVDAPRRVTRERRRKVDHSKGKMEPATAALRNH